MLVEGVPDNLLLLLSGRLTWPAVAMLLDSDTPGFDALIAPGISLVALEPEIAVASTRLPGDFHGDPADRLIVATARQHGPLRR